MTIARFRKTKRPSRKKKDREARKQRILTGAMDLIELRGMSGMSLHQLAKELEYTVGALYRYFPSKDALIAELQCNVIDALHSAFRLLTRDAIAFAEDKECGEKIKPLFCLLLFVEFYSIYSVESKAHFRLNARIIGDSKSWLKDEEPLRVLLAAAQVFADVEALFAEAGLSTMPEEGSFPEKAFLFWSALHGIMQTQKLSRLTEFLDNARLVKNFTHTLFRGWGAKDEELQAAEELTQQFIEENPIKKRARIKRLPESK